VSPVSWTTLTDPILGGRPRTRPNAENRPNDQTYTAAQEKPYTEMPGGAKGVTSANIIADAANLFPTQYLATASRPAAFSTAPASLSPDEFLKWHSTYQVDYIRANGTAFDGDTEKNWVKLGPVDGKTISVFLAAKATTGSEAQLYGEKLYIVENLQKADIAPMSKATQVRLAQIPAWFTTSSGQASKLGYTPVSTSASLTSAAVDSTRTALKSKIDTEFIATITNTAAITDTAGTVRPSTEVKALFTQQLENIKTRLDNCGVFDAQTLVDAANEIKTRFDRLMAFAIGKTAETVDTTKSIYISADSVGTVNVLNYPNALFKKNVVSLDDNKTIIEGYDKFVDTEKRNLQVDNLKIYLGNIDGIRPKALDVSRIIFLLQMAYNLSKETQSDQGAEELRQQNRYLQDIAAIKQIIQTTRSGFGTKSDEYRAVLGLEQLNDDTVANDMTSLSDIQRLAISMWEDLIPQKEHPIEKLRNLGTRPTFQVFHTGYSSDSYRGVNLQYGGSTNTYTNNYYIIRKISGSYYSYAGAIRRLAGTWDQYGQKVSDRTTLVQQDAQIVQNKVSNLDKEKARHFELANNAVNKMFDMLQSILRAG
jgi:hypothetical protein